MFKILLIEEESSLREVIKFALEDDFQVFLAENTNQAWEMMTGSETRPDLIIMRLFHSKSKNFLLYKYGRTEFRQLPVIFLEREEERIQNRSDEKSKKNNWHYLDLPVNPEKILVLARKCLLLVS